MKKSKPEYNGVVFDSGEELEVYHWMLEAMDNSLISKDSCYHPEPFDLSDTVKMRVAEMKNGKIKERDKTVLRPHIYTPDYIIVTERVIPGYVYDLELGIPRYYFDVKGGFSLYNNHREFSINQKWVFKKAQRFVNKLEPECFFGVTWCPMVARITPKTGKIRQKYRDMRTIEDIKVMRSSGDLERVLPKYGGIRGI